MGQQLRVLVVEDEPLIRALVTMAFEAEGYDVDTAADGAEALARACQQPPQAIVLDLMMPVMNGWDFLDAWQCPRLRSRRDQQVPQSLKHPS
jgi:CheY-like chemotaxis protein